jgi:hypothetical protein
VYICVHQLMLQLMSSDMVSTGGFSKNICNMLVNKDGFSLSRVGCIFFLAY